jgi:hypothetical protein
LSICTLLTFSEDPGQDADTNNDPTQNPIHSIRKKQRIATDRVLRNLGYEYVGWQDPVGRVSVDYDYGHGYGNHEGWRSQDRERSRSSERGRRRQKPQTYAVDYRDTARMV